MYNHAAQLRVNAEEAKEEMRLLRKEATIEQPGIELLVTAYKRKADELGVLGRETVNVYSFYNGILLAYGLFQSISQAQLLEEIPPAELAEILEKEAQHLATILDSGPALARRIKDTVEPP